MGFNHDGDLELAKSYLKKLARLGVDCLKFQLFRPDRLLSQQVGDEVKNIFRQHHLSTEDYLELVSLAAELDIEIAASVFDPETLNWYVQNTSPPFLKIASGDITYRRLLEAAGETGVPVVLSTGAATRKEIDRALEWLRPAKKIILLHCQPQYPAAEHKLNLRRIKTLADNFNRPVGFSDHSQSELAPAVAAHFGACFWERHVTTDNSRPGPEHSFSLPLADFARLSENLPHTVKRLTEEIISRLASSGQPPKPGDWSDYRLNARRSLAAAHQLEVDEKLTPDAVVELRPATGLPPAEIYDYLGAAVKTPLEAGEIITASHLNFP